MRFEQQHRALRALTGRWLGAMAAFLISPPRSPRIGVRSAAGSRRRFLDCACTASCLRCNRVSLRSRCPHEFPRIPSQGIVRRVRHPGAARQDRVDAGAGGRSRQGARWRAMDGQGADPRRWSRQGRRREVRASRSTRSRRLRPGCSARSMETYQSGGRALPVNLVLVTEATDIAKELYLSILVDRDSKAVVVHRLGARRRRHRAGRARERRKTSTRSRSISSRACSRTSAASLGFDMGLNAKQVNQLTKIMLGLYKLFNEKDLALVELNPLAIVDDRRSARARRQGQFRRQRRVPPSEARRDARRDRRKTRPKPPRSSTTSTT